MTSREQFEAWYSRETGASIRLLKVLRARDDYCETYGDRLSLAWMARQASREALGIDGMAGLKTNWAPAKDEDL